MVLISKEIKKRIGESVYLWRAKKKLSRKAAAELFGMGIFALQRVEIGECHLRVYDAYNIAKVMEIRIEDLIEEERLEA